MATAPLVSIILPTYNAEAFIFEAVHSALRQTYQNIEVLVIDDGSTDKTRDLLKDLTRAGTIRYMYQENRGLSAARNRGLREAKGKYIALLDSDDICSAERIELQVAALEENKSFDVCYSDLLHFVDFVPRAFYHHRYFGMYHSGNLLREFLKKQFINPSTVFVRRELFERNGYFNEALKRSEDWDLWLRWSYAGTQFYFLNKILVYYRIRTSENLTSLESEPLMREANLLLFSDFFNRLESHERNDFNEKELFHSLEKKATAAYLIVGDTRNALKHLARAREYQSSISTVVLSIMIFLLPKEILKHAGILARSIKHRLLLSRLKIPESFAPWERYPNAQKYPHNPEGAHIIK